MTSSPCLNSMGKQVAHKALRLELGIHAASFLQAQSPSLRTSGRLRSLEQKPQVQETRLALLRPLGAPDQALTPQLRGPGISSHTPKAAPLLKVPPAPQEGVAVGVRLRSVSSKWLD